MPKSYPSVKFIVIAVCALYLSSVQAKTFGGKVVGIADGDTLTVVTRSKRQHKIRLAGIDAPEKHQPFGERSRQSLSDLCFGKRAEVTSRVVDRYKRVVANVKCDGVNVNAEQVSRGMAWTYRRYVDRNYHFYLLEFSARLAKRGLWADPNPVAPWQWRNHRTRNVRALFPPHVRGGARDYSSGRLVEWTLERKTQGAAMVHYRRRRTTFMVGIANYRFYLSGS